ncbi:MAG: hypothetical protein RBR22_09635 [Desulfuromonas sp.]|jgi:hypothetical protein|nr:hypothetical protein [Desulfuromonas sp.]
MMTKKSFAIIALSAFVFGTSNLALAKSFKGEVTQVTDTTVTIQLAKKDVKKIDVGDNAKISIKKATKPTAGASALTGC